MIGSKFGSLIGNLSPLNAIGRSRRPLSFLGFICRLNSRNASSSNNFLKTIINQSNYGSNTTNDSKKYLVEFVSANPTGPLHVGHCRGAILGDVLSNLLIYNNNNVTKEYYVNDFRGQINNFTKSIFLIIII